MRHPLDGTVESRHRPLGSIEATTPAAAATSAVERPRVLDLRGSGGAVARGVGVLEDPSGRRRRFMRGLGRAAASCLALWLAALLLGGLGLFPTGGLPFAGVLTPATAPPPLGGGDAQSRQAPAGLRASPAEPRPEASRAGAGRDRGVGSARHAARRERTVPAPGSGDRAGRGRTRHAVGVAPTAPARSPIRSGPTGTAPGRSTAPAHTGTAPGPTTAPAQTGTAPGRTTAPGQTGTSPGQATAPGQTGTSPGQPTVPGHSGTSAALDQHGAG
jgi:hypothetical protein